MELCWDISGQGGDPERLKHSKLKESFDMGGKNEKDSMDRCGSSHGFRVVLHERVWISR